MKCNDIWQNDSANLGGDRMQATNSEINHDLLVDGEGMLNAK